MAKYINTSKFRIIVNDGKDLINFLPGETLETEAIIPQLYEYLISEAKPSKIKLVEDTEETLDVSGNPVNVKKKTYKVRGK
jgi:hypothetical protein